VVHGNSNCTGFKNLVSCLFGAVQLHYNFIHFISSTLISLFCKTLCTNSTLLSMNKEENPCQCAKFWQWSVLGSACTLRQCLRFGGRPQPGDQRMVICTETHEQFQTQMSFSPAKHILFRNASISGSAASDKHYGRVCFKPFLFPFFFPDEP